MEKWRETVCTLVPLSIFAASIDIFLPIYGIVRHRKINLHLEIFQDDNYITDLVLWPLYYFYNRS